MHHVIVSSQVRDVWISMGFLPQTIVLWESFNLLLAEGGSSPFYHGESQLSHRLFFSNHLKQIQAILGFPCRFGSGFSISGGGKIVLMNICPSIQYFRNVRSNMG